MATRTWEIYMTEAMCIVNLRTGYIPIPAEATPEQIDELVRLLTEASPCAEEEADDDT